MAMTHEDRVALARRAQQLEDDAASLLGRAAGPVGVGRGKWLKRLDAAAQKHPQAQQRLLRANAARWSLALTMERWVQKEVSRGKWVGHLSQGDLLQEGLLGAHRAAVRWDAGRGMQFSTYAGHWIRVALVRAFERAQPLSMPLNWVYKQRGIRQLVSEQPALSDQEISTQLRLSSVACVGPLREGRTAVGFDTPIPGTDGLTVGDGLGSPDVDLDAHLAAVDSERLLAELPPRDAYIVRRAHLQGATMVEIAAELDLSRQRVDQLRQRGLGRLAELVGGPR